MGKLPRQLACVCRPVQYRRRRLAPLVLLLTLLHTFVAGVGASVVVTTVFEDRVRHRDQLCL